ncbi:MAG: hypothetical protein K6F91_10310, partial [Ruminococcus sp.]|nr:hypothetical protein [Ruminococcus sp.]
METKICPHCGKEIQKEAILCKFCHSLLVEQGEDEGDAPANGDTIIFKKAEPSRNDSYEPDEYDDIEEPDEEELERQREKARRVAAARRRAEEEDDEYDYDDEDDDEEDDDDKKRLYIMVLVIAVGIIVVAIVCLAVATKLFGGNSDSDKITVKNTTLAPAVSKDESADSANTDDDD